MSESKILKLEDRVQFLREEVDAFKRQSYQQADLLSDVVPALARLGHASNDETVEAALALARSVTDNSQNVDAIRVHADGFLSAYKAARDSGLLQSPDALWRAELATALDELGADNPAVQAATARLRDNTPLECALKPLISALHTEVLTDSVDSDTCHQLAQAVLTLPLEPSEQAHVSQIDGELHAPTVEPEVLQGHCKTLTSLLERGLYAAQLRDQQVQHLVAQMHSELEAVEGFLSALSGRDDTAVANAENIQTAVGSDSADMLSIFDHSESLSDIRHHVATRAQTIRANMAAFVERARADRDRAAVESRVLSDRMVALEGELAKTQAALAKAEASATHDYLTGLLNRRAFEDVMARRLSDAGSTAGLCCVIWDIDFFKQINDSHGHLAGDDVLKGVAEVLNRHAGDSALVARIGGEEFVAVIHGTEAQAVMSWANAVRESVSGTAFEHAGSTVNATVSCGIASFQRGDSLVSLLARADKALYDAKAAGRDCCRLAV